MKTLAAWAQTLTTSLKRLTNRLTGWRTSTPS